MDAPAARALRSTIRLLAALEGYQLRLWREQRVTVTQLRAVFRISSSERATVGEIADHLNITPSTATGLVERLVAQNLVERHVRAGDRRVCDLELTARGRGLAELGGGGRQSHLRTALGQLPDAELTSLAATVDRLTALLEATETDTSLRRRLGQGG
ncbi:MAG: hypothetical protein NVSMB29_16790 [Candidatus Dormibacteria bacterium]